MNDENKSLAASERECANTKTLYKWNLNWTVDYQLLYQYTLYVLVYTVIEWSHTLVHTGYRVPHLSFDLCMNYTHYATIHWTQIVYCI